MKQILLIVLFIVLCISSFGQKIRFTDSTNVWKIRISGYDYGLTQPIATSRFTGDTIIDSQQYLILGSFFIREDTIAGKVYIRYHNPCVELYDPIERVLYDYNWAVGDTVRQSNYCDRKTTCWVTSIDSTKIDSIWYKVWHFNGVDTTVSGLGPIKYSVIEGIGCLSGSVFAIAPRINFEYSQQVICFNNGGPLSKPVHVWGWYSSINFDNSISCKLDLINTTHHSPITSVIPNPINEHSMIVLSYNIASGSVVVINGIGQVIMSNDFQNKEELPVGDQIKTPGLYYYRVTDHISGEIFSGKLMYR